MTHPTLSNLLPALMLTVILRAHSEMRLFRVWCTFLKLLAKQPDHPNCKRHIFYNSTIGKWSYKKFWFYCMVSISLISATIQIQHKWIEFHSTNNLEFTTKGTFSCRYLKRLIKFSVHKYKVLVQLWIILWLPVILSILIHYYLFVFPEEMSYLFGFRLVGVIQVYCVCWKCSDAASEKHRQWDLSG